MDIHRCRFVNYPTSAINALAFSHSSALNLANDHISSLRLAVGRANGDVEIWNPNQKSWFQETIFHAGRNRSIEGLVWTQDPDEEDEDGQVTVGPLRLFSIGYSSTLTEWSLETGLPARNWTGNNSEIWCVAAQPRIRPEQGKSAHSSCQKIIVGCADGCLIILSTESGGLQFSKYLTRAISKRARVLSLAFHDQDTLVAGYADSTIRIYDLKQGNIKRSISLGAGPKVGPKDILVWAVKCLENGSIVSGDSIGEVRVFESKQYSQTQRIASHDADILSLAVRKSTSTIFSAGMDRKTTVYEKRMNKDQWNKSSQASHHEHDVKAMAAFEGNKLHVVASGG
jgi:U3 small nucleolar RNA-associated protein 4